MILITMTLNGCNNKKAEEIEITSEEKDDFSREGAMDQKNRMNYEETATASRNVHDNKDLKLNDFGKYEKNIDNIIKTIEAEQDDVNSNSYKGSADKKLSTSE